MAACYRHLYLFPARPKQNDSVYSTIHYPFASISFYTVTWKRCVDYFDCVEINAAFQVVKRKILEKRNTFLQLGLQLFETLYTQYIQKRFILTYRFYELEPSCKVFISSEYTCMRLCFTFSKRGYLPKTVLCYPLLASGYNVIRGGFTQKRNRNGRYIKTQ